MFVSGQCNNGLETYHCGEIGNVKMGPLKTCTFDKQKLGGQKCTMEFATEMCKGWLSCRKHILAFFKIDISIV